MRTFAQSLALIALTACNTEPPVVNVYPDVDIQAPEQVPPTVVVEDDGSTPDDACNSAEWRVTDPVTGIEVETGAVVSLSFETYSNVSYIVANSHEDGNLGKLNVDVFGCNDIEILSVQATERQWNGNPTWFLDREDDRFVLQILMPEVGTVGGFVANGPTANRVMGYLENGWATELHTPEEIAAYDDEYLEAYAHYMWTNLEAFGQQAPVRNEAEIPSYEMRPHDRAQIWLSRSRFDNVPMYQPTNIEMYVIWRVVGGSQTFITYSGARTVMVVPE